VQSAPLSSLPASAPQAAKEALSALEQLRVASESKFLEAKGAISRSFSQFAALLKQREAVLLAELSATHQAELDAVKQREAALHQLVAAFDSSKGSDQALAPIEHFRNVARADAPSWNVSRFVDDNANVAHQLSLAGGVFSPPRGSEQAKKAVSVPAAHHAAKEAPAVHHAPKEASATSKPAKAKPEKDASAPTNATAHSQPAVPHVRPIGGVTPVGTATHHVAPAVTATAHHAVAAVAVPADISSLIRPVGSAAPINVAAPATTPQAPASTDSAQSKKKAKPQAASAAPAAAAPTSAAPAAVDDGAWEVANKGPRKPKQKASAN